MLKTSIIVSLISGAIFGFLSSCFVDKLTKRIFARSKYLELFQGLAHLLADIIIMLLLFHNPAMLIGAAIGLILHIGLRIWKSVYYLQTNRR